MSASIHSRLLDILEDMGRLARTMDLQSCEHKDTLEVLVFRLEDMVDETIGLERAAEDSEHD